ncbi:MAG: NADH-quinone oxidoreductase subunit K [Candidatus Omnitrophica bacterium]|nr:NADH-quinone oxidoreductase subunit K [Candidatus Omnitrophota bacterium]
MILYMLCLYLFGMGLYCLLRKRNMIKMIMGIVIAQYAVNLFFVLNANDTTQGVYQTAVDPVPQVVVLTSIVVGLAMVLVLIALSLRIYEKYGTFDITKIRDLRQ